MTDERYEELMSPQPTFIVRSLRDDPDYIKCPRCWHYTHEGLHNHEGLCDRCCNVLLEAWPDHESIPHIKQRREEWKKAYDTRQMESQTHHETRRHTEGVEPTVPAQQ